MGNNLSLRAQQALSRYPKTVNGLLIGLMENLHCQFIEKRYGKQGLLQTLFEAFQKFVKGGFFAVLEFLYLDTSLSLIAGQLGHANWSSLFSEAPLRQKLLMVAVFVCVEQALLIAGKYIY